MTALVAAVGAAGPSLAQGEITGEVVPTMELTIADPSADFGTDLRPQGTASNSTDTVVVDVDGASPSSGACYEWAGSVTVNSNVAYDITFTPAAANTSLDVLAADPADHAACVSGTPIGTTTILLVDAAPAATGAVHQFWLGLEVGWTTPPSAALGSASLTVEVVQDAP